MEIIDFKNTYWNYYKQLESDLFETVPYCTIDKVNNDAFSMKYLQLHLSICSEIDTISKTFCKLLDSTVDTSLCGITDYIKIFNVVYPTFFQEKLTINGYKYREIQPWKGIDKGHVPNWWNIYNEIKHHRDITKNNKENYKLANQKNIIDSLSALYILMEYWVTFHFAIDKMEKMNHVIPQFRSRKFMLSNWKFYESYMGQPEWFNTQRYFKYIERSKL